MELDALVIAPHPDDAELGMGGGILKMLAAGLKVGVLDLTDGEPTPHGSPAIRANETKIATEALGLSWRGNLGLPNRSLEATLENRKAWPVKSGNCARIGCSPPSGSMLIPITSPQLSWSRRRDSGRN